jgi:hypothetical protein
MTSYKFVDMREMGGRTAPVKEEIGRMAETRASAWPHRAGETAMPFYD